MESDWRYNVARFGQAYNGIQYFARLRTFVPPFYNYLMKLNGFDNMFYASIVGEQLVTYGGGALPPAGHPHFPWGVEVDAD